MHQIHKKRLKLKMTHPACLLCHVQALLTLRSVNTVLKKINCVPGTTKITFLRHVVIHLHTVQLMGVPLCFVKECEVVQ